ncbi:IS110 family transposase [Rhodocaloribacter litoris]|uniref:IS110 family transposase n=1 Tax=Rhodocaloribacter litoris TaxID=2558931 RepID=UPI001424A0FB|nr:IS110 family transposase [Rhodocaloribacter litoris]QXD16478.1 IS110 family transposase [Rhodocaloribacter litoris]
MRFYDGQHTHYAGVDLHTKTMFVCVLDATGTVLLERNTLANPKSFLKAITPFREELVVGCECIFTWYWLADLCEREGIAFVLGHALYMKAVHGGKTKNDRQDAHTIARLLRGGTFPLAHVYPKEKRATRDLLRRRTHFVRKRAERLAHVQNTSWQYRLESFGRRLANRSVTTCRDEVVAAFDDPQVRASVEADLDLIAHYDRLIRKLERQLEQQARIDDRRTYDLLRSIPGVGQVLALIFLYEIDDVTRFDSHQQFCSYARLIRPTKTSAGKAAGLPSFKQIGNGHLKWAFSEAALVLMRESKAVKGYVERMTQKHGKGKALGILSHKLGRSLYYMLRRGQYFDEQTFLQTA